MDCVRSTCGLGPVRKSRFGEAGRSRRHIPHTLVYPIDGAVHRVPKDATTWPARDAAWSMVIAGVDPYPSHAEALKAWGRAYWKAVHPYNMDGGYVNFLMDDEAAGRIPASYGENYPRLRQGKAKYDPNNLFRVNHNIEPAS